MFGLTQAVMIVPITQNTAATSAALHNQLKPDQQFFLDSLYTTDVVHGNPAYEGQKRIDDI